MRHHIGIATHIMWIHAERFYPHRTHISRHTITNKGMSGWWSGRVEVPFGRHQHRDATWRASLPHTSLEHGDQEEFEMRWASVGLVLGFSNANEQVEDGKHKVAHDVWRRKFWIWFLFVKSLFGTLLLHHHFRIWGILEIRGTGFILLCLSHRREILQNKPSVCFGGLRFSSQHKLTLTMVAQVK